MRDNRLRLLKEYYGIKQETPKEMYLANRNTFIGIDICYSDRDKEETFSYCIAKDDGNVLSIIDIKTLVNRGVYSNKRPSEIYIAILRKLYPNAIMAQESN
jgi:hypothetical protein